MITTGYLNGPSTASNAKAIQADPTGNMQPAGIVLSAMYWPVGIPHTRPGFADGNVPFRIPSGQCVTLPYYEAAALVTAGAAKWV